MTLVQTDAPRVAKLLGAPQRASAQSRIIPAGEALLIEPGARLVLHLRNGRRIDGRFRQRVMLDSAVYASRFAAAAETSAFVPIALGESLNVTLEDGRERTAPFRGYGALTLLLESPEPSRPFRVPFESAIVIRRADGERVEPDALTRAFRAGALPSAEGLAIDARTPQPLERAAGFVRGEQIVAIEDIHSVSLDLPSGGGKVVAVILVSVVLAVGLTLLIIGAALNGIDDSCGSSPILSDPNPFGVRLTDRPFDLERGGFVGDDFSVAHLWPADTVSMPGPRLGSTTQPPPSPSAAIGR